jgi:hypothetical protein
MHTRLLASLFTSLFAILFESTRSSKAGLFLSFENQAVNTRPCERQSARAANTVMLMKRSDAFIYCAELAWLIELCAVESRENLPLYWWLGPGARNTSRAIGGIARKSARD